MINLVNKFINKLLTPQRYYTFITFDNNTVSGLIYFPNNENPKDEGKLICSATIPLQHKISTTNNTQHKLSLALATCLDDLEEKSELRIKSVIVNLVGFHSQSYHHSLVLPRNTPVNPHNMGLHINVGDLEYRFGDHKVITNLLPLKIHKTKTDKRIELVVAGFTGPYLLQLSEIFYNLSLEIQNIIFAPLALPFILPTMKVAVAPLMMVSSDYTLLYSKKHIECINFGTNSILENISAKAGIPFGTIHKYDFIIRQILQNHDESLLYRLDDYLIEDIKHIIEASVGDYLQSFSHLITSKNLHKHDKITVVNNNLKFFQEMGLLSNFTIPNIEFHNTNFGAKLTHLDLSITEVLNKASLKYYLTNLTKDLALHNFSKRMQKVQKGAEEVL